MTEPTAVSGAPSLQARDAPRRLAEKSLERECVLLSQSDRDSRIESLDALRGLMALAVAAYHLSGWTHVAGRATRASSFFAALGIYSVEGFFIISGFCFFHLYGETRFDLATLKRFHLKRFVRIAPLYYAVLALDLALGQGAWAHFSWGRLLENLTLSFGLFHPNHAIVMGGWSIGIEYVFYLLFPLLAFFKRMRAGVYVLAIVLAAAAFPFTFELVQQAVEAQKFNTYVRIPNHAFLFLLGGVVADVRKRVPLRLGLLPLGCGLVALLALVAHGLRGRPIIYDHYELLLGTTRLTCLGLCLLVVLLFALARPTDSRFFKPWVWLGDLSYAVYLLHPLAWLTLGKLLPGDASALSQFGGGLGLTIAFAALAHHGLERPCMAWGKRRSSLPVQVPAPVPSPSRRLSISSSAQAAGTLHCMPVLIPAPTRVEAVGSKPKRIEEFVGRVNNAEARVSVARMRSPSGWVEPGQRPEFDEYTLVLEGALTVESEQGTLVVSAGQAVLTKAGEWVRYSTPGEQGAEYIAVCLPAFSPTTVHRDP